MNDMLVFFASWLAGSVTYVASCAVFYRQSIGAGDLKAVLFSSLIVYGLAFLLVYRPALRGLRRRLGGVRPLWPFPVVATMLGVVPTALIGFFYGGNLDSLLSAEAALFYSMFSAVGIVVGCGFVLTHRQTDRDNPTV